MCGGGGGGGSITVCVTVPNLLLCDKFRSKFYLVTYLYRKVIIFSIQMTVYRSFIKLNIEEKLMNLKLFPLFPLKTLLSYIINIYKYMHASSRHKTYSWSQLEAELFSVRSLFTSLSRYTTILSMVDVLCYLRTTAKISNNRGQKTSFHIMISDYIFDWGTYS